MSQQLNADAGGPRPATFTGRVKIYHSATATFVSPSDPCGVGGARCEQIKATPSWFCGPDRYDMVFMNTDDTREDMQGMEVARVVCFFSLPCTNGVSYPCAVRSGPSEGRGQRQPNNQHPSDCNNARRGPPKLR